MITLLLLVRATYMYGVVLHAHPVRFESHNQRNTTGEVATVGLLSSIPYICFQKTSTFFNAIASPLNMGRKSCFFAQATSDHVSGVDSGRILCFSFGPGVKNL